MTTKVEMTKAEEKRFKVVAKAFRNRDSSNVMLSYVLGREVDVTMEEAKANSEHYSHETIEKYAEELDCSPAMLYSPARVYRAWSKKADFKKLADLRHPDGWQLYWTHFVYLANMGVAAKRNTLAERAFRKRMPVAELFDLIQVEKQKLKAKKETRGRKNRLVPKSTADCLNHMRTQSEFIVNQADENWFGDKFNIITELQDMPIDKINEDLLGEMNEIVSEMRGVSSSFITYAEDLERLVAELDKKRTAKPPSTTYAGETTAGETTKANQPRRSKRGRTGIKRKGRVGV
jgi:hypothetical protein